MIDPVRLNRLLTTHFCGRHLIQFPTIDSTNRVLFEWLRARSFDQRVPLPEGTILVATRQEAGRGQRGRSWSSPAGGLYLSLALLPQGSVMQLLDLTLALVWGVVIQFRSHCDLDLRIKWPNDIVTAHPAMTESTQPCFQKLAGILLQSRALAPDRQGVVVGFGMNVNNPVPADGISLAQLTGAPWDLTKVAAHVLAGLEMGYLTWQDSGLSAIQSDYENLMIHHQAKVVLRGGEPATVLGVAGSGALRVQTQAGLDLIQPEDVQLGYGTHRLPTQRGAAE